MKTVAKPMCIVLAFMLMGCMSSLPKDVPSNAETYKNKVDIKIMGSRRSYLVHVPPAHVTRSPLPLVIAVHGAFETAKDMEERTGLSDLADQEGFVAVYPNGMGLLGFLQHWNAGHCCGKAAADNVDDVGFLKKVLEDVHKRLPIDKNRIYMVGFSNGGMLAYRFAAENSEILSALAVVAATIGSRSSSDVPFWQIPDPNAPLPLIAFHGLDDDAIPAQGGISPKRGGDQSFISVEDSMGFWVRSNGCDSEPMLNQIHQNHIRINTWQGCRDNADVVLYLMENWQHVWPGRYYTADLGPENPLKDFDAVDLIWDFFTSHTRIP